MNPKDVRVASFIAENDSHAAETLARFLIDEKAMRVIEKDGVKAYSVYVYTPPLKS